MAASLPVVPVANDHRTGRGSEYHTPSPVASAPYPHQLTRAVAIGRGNLRTVVRVDGRLHSNGHGRPQASKAAPVGCPDTNPGIRVIAAAASTQQTASTATTRRDPGRGIARRTWIIGRRLQHVGGWDPAGGAGWLWTAMVPPVGALDALFHPFHSPQVVEQAAEHVVQGTTLRRADTSLHSATALRHRQNPPTTATKDPRRAAPAPGEAAKRQPAAVSRNRLGAPAVGLPITHGSPHRPTPPHPRLRETPVATTPAPLAATGSPPPTPAAPDATPAAARQPPARNAASAA